MPKEMQLTPTSPPQSLQKQTNFTSSSTSYPMGLDRGNSMKNENTPSVFKLAFEKQIRSIKQKNSSTCAPNIHIGAEWCENVMLVGYFISMIFFAS